MEQLNFDTHAFVKRLTGAGMPETQAEVLAEEQVRLINERLATKRDIAELKRDLMELKTELKRDLKELETRLEGKIETLRVEIKRDIAEVKVDILKWMFGALLGQTAIITALIKLL